MRNLFIDLETFSSIDIKKSGLYKYVESPDFQILLFAYSFDYAPVQIIDLAQGESIPYAVLNALFDPNVLKHAYNAAFEWYCLCKYFYNQANTAWLSQWRCVMLHGLYCGYTAGLEATGAALGLPQEKQKLSIGKALIRTFCVPCTPSKSNGYRTRTLPHHEPEKWKLFKEYCCQDVVTEMEIEKRLFSFPVPDAIQKEWELDQRINARGIKVDIDLIDGALSVHDTIKNELMSEATALTGLENPNSVSQLLQWLSDETGQDVENLRKDTVKALLKGKKLSSETAKRMLEIRQEMAKTSIKKYNAMQTGVCKDQRIRGAFQFYGANRTGRWAGRFVQLQNLPRNYLATLSLARKYVKQKNVTALKLLYGNVPDTLSQLIRTAFIPSEGNMLIVADFNAIEARIIAWLAGEQWVMDVFASHGKIYEATASQMFGVPIERIVKGNPEYALRQKGKIATLALGYGGGTGALISMGALEQGLTEEELPDIVRRWRAANKRIVDLWYGIESAALECMRTARQTGVRSIIFSREGDILNGQDFLTITLPSGRKLYYTKPFLSQNQFGNESIHYCGMDQKSKKWLVLDTWGGKLVENIVQAIARDCLAISMLRLEEAGYRIVMHIHDEVVLDVPNGADIEDRLRQVCEIMGRPIPWAQGLLLRAEGFITEFYKKD